MPVYDGDPKLLKDYIAEALLILMRKMEFDKITIQDITEKAGVNRSTYYRNFKSKTDVIRYFYVRCLREYLDTIDGMQISPKDYFVGMFVSFRKHKDALLMLEEQGFSYLLLDVMNQYFQEDYSEDELLKKYRFYYHTGGVFNTFALWLSDDMSTEPEELADLCLRFLPEDFRPFLHRPGN